MKKLLIIALAILLVLLIAIPLVTRYLGPRILSVAPPKGNPIGEFDLPKPETSLVAVNIALPIDLMAALANEKAPTEFEGTEKKNFHKRIKDGQYTWKIVRGDIALANTGHQIGFATPFAGGAHVQGKIDAKILSIPLNSTVEISGHVGGAMSPRITPEWQIDPQFVPQLNIAQANLSLAGIGKIDVSKILNSNLSQYVQQEAAKLMPALSKELKLREEIEKFWAQGHLSQLVNDDPNVWVSVTPKEVLLAPIDYSDPSQISFAVGIRSHTFLTNRDPGVPQPAPLPDLTPLDGPVATDLRLPIIVSIKELNEMLATEKIDIDTGVGTKVSLSNIQAQIGQGGLLDLRVSLQADKSRLGRGVTGDVWLQARPVIDIAEQTLGFADVELSLETRDKLTTAATWLLEGILTSGIEGQLRADLDDYKEEINEEVQKALKSSDVPEGLEISLQNLEINLADIYTVTRYEKDGPKDPGIVIVINAKADMATTVNSLILKPSDTP